MLGFQARVNLVFALIVVLGGLSSFFGSGGFVLAIIASIVFAFPAIYLLAAHEEKRLLKDIVRIDREVAVSNSRATAEKMGWAFDQRPDVRLRFPDHHSGNPSWEVRWEVAGPMLSEGRVWVDAVTGDILRSDNNLYR